MAYDPNDPADKALFDAAVAEATAGLTSKRDELLKEVKDLKKKISQGAADPQAMERLQEQLDEANAKLETANADLKKASKDRDKNKADFDNESAYSKKLLVDNGLTSALTSANVAKQFVPAVTAMFAGKVEVKTENGERKLFIGDKPLGEAITAFAQSDEGKHFIGAGNNTGGNANGGAGGNAKSINRATFDAMGHAERSAFFADGGTVTN